MARYLTNRKKWTEQKWEVVERYTTSFNRYWSWNRALLRAEDGSTLRIFYYYPYWRMGQRVLAPNRKQLIESNFQLGGQR